MTSPRPGVGVAGRLRGEPGRDRPRPRPRRWSASTAATIRPTATATSCCASWPATRSGSATRPSGRAGCGRARSRSREAAAAEGLVPSLMFQSGADPSWTASMRTPVTRRGDAGLRALQMRLDHDLPGPGMTGTALSHTRIEVVPYIAAARGGRLFDHNRNPSDLDNYTMHLARARDRRNDAVCAPPAGPTHAQPRVRRRLVRSIARASSRPAATSDDRLRQTRACDRAATRRAATRSTTSPRTCCSSRAASRCDVSVRDGAATLSVPSDARRRHRCGSRTRARAAARRGTRTTGANYVFDALVPPQWIGNARR